MIDKINNTLDRILAVNIYTNVYGLARSLLAIGTLLTLVFNSSDVLFRPNGVLMTEAFGDTHPLLAYSLFSLLPFEHVIFARLIGIGILLLVITGWRPRFTGIFHWWVTVSFSTSSIVVDGGDQIASILCLLLIPVTLADSRKSHWVEHKEQRNVNLGSQVLHVNALIALFVIKLQVAVVYFHAAVGKTMVTEWVNGTVLYYWFIDPVFGMTPWLRDLAVGALASPYVSVFGTWGVIIFEILLFGALFMTPKGKKVMFFLGLLFHASIIVVHGLVSFFFSMGAALILYLWPIEKSFGKKKKK
ncbi:MAG: sporulation-delaying protein SdpB family protein, partial [Rhodothermales bacterium]